MTETDDDTQTKKERAEQFGRMRPREAAGMGSRMACDAKRGAPGLENTKPAPNDEPEHIGSVVVRVIGKLRT